MQQNALFFMFVSVLGFTVIMFGSQFVPDLACDSSQILQTRTEDIETRSSADLFDGLPHVDTCNYCERCYVPIYNRSNGDRTKHVSRSLLWPKLPREAQFGRLYDKSHYPNCSECWGCRQYMQRLGHKNMSEFNLDGFEAHIGESSGEVYGITDPNVSDEEYIVKLWCVVSANAKKPKTSKCKEEEMSIAIQIALAVQRIVDECTFRSIVSNAWVAPINAVLPKTGFHVDWDGLWAEQAKGIPLDSFVEDSIDNGMDPDEFEDILNNRLNSTEIAMATILDLLTCQADRHTQNVYISESGHITLIDNDEAWGHAWRPVGVDSIFLPSTQYHTIQHIGNNYVRKKSKKPRQHPLGSVVFDYRCHVPNGVIGTDYPAEARGTMERIVNMTIDLVQEHYYLPERDSARYLKQRAKDMLERGFEWTLQNGRPRSAPSLRYPWHPKCCRIKVVPDTSDVECAEASYTRVFTRPDGDPVHGEYR